MAQRISRFRFQPAPGSKTEVLVGSGALDLLASRLSRLAPGRWHIVSSVPVWERHGKKLLRALTDASFDRNPLLVPEGEKAKSWNVLGRILVELTEKGIRRDGGVIVFGGGTVGDVGGLAASLILRGVPVVQIPTTLLAASDSALGGKTAVDLPAGKNLAGTVHHPSLVVVSTELLATLPERDYRSGLAEVVKSSFLDLAFHRAFPRLEAGLKTRAPNEVAEAVSRSLRMKARIVASDPLERTGNRFALNLGHTVGHALETASGHSLAHGEAVAWGLLAILEVSNSRGLLSRAMTALLAERVLRLCAPPALGLRTLAGWKDRLASDKKSNRQGLRAVLLSGPGETLNSPVVVAELEEALSAARNRWAASRTRR